MPKTQTDGVDQCVPICVRFAVTEATVSTRADIRFGMFAASPCVITFCMHVPTDHESLQPAIGAARPRVREMLLERDSRAVNARSDEMDACLGREMTIVRKKIPPDTKGLYGDSALHAACSNGHVEVGQHCAHHTRGQEAASD